MVRNAFTMAEPARCYLEGPTEGMAMRDETLKEKARITAGAVAALVIVGWLAIIALALMAVL